MLSQIVGVLVAAATGAVVAVCLMRAWPLARWGQMGAPIVAAFAAGLANVLLQLLGAGELRFMPDFGQIYWRPVLSTLIAGALVGLISTICLGLIRYGGRSASSFFR